MTVSARWVISATVQAVSALHVGSGEAGIWDLTLRRDPVDPSLVLIPGDSLAGALRSHLADVMDGYFSKERDAVAGLFGHTLRDKAPAQSRIITHDAHISPGATEIRAMVSLDPETRTAAESLLFDAELVPAGASWDIRVGLDVKAGDDEPMLLACLAAALDGLTDGEIRFGARRTRGLGQVRAANWRAVRFDLQRPSGWQAFLAFDPSGEVDASAHDTARASLEAAGGTPGVLPDKRRRIVVAFQASVEGEILMGGTGQGLTDREHHLSGDSPLLVGSGLAGAMRQRALQIASLLPGRKPAAVVDALFGPRTDGDQGLWQSRLRVSESKIEGGKATPRTRNRLDRLTQGVIDGGLFDETPSVGGAVDVAVELRCPADAKGWSDRGLILLLAKDLITGDLPLGGTTGIGRGRLRATELTIVDQGPGATNTEVTLTVDTPNETADAMIGEFWGAGVPA